MHEWIGKHYHVSRISIFYVYIIKYGDCNSTSNIPGKTKTGKIKNNDRERERERENNWIVRNGGDFFK